VCAGELDRVGVRGQAGGPDVGDEFVDGVHAGQHRRVHAGGRAGQPVVAFLRGGAGGPEGLAAGQPEAGERVGGGQRLQVRGGQLGAAGQVDHVAVGAVGVAFVFDALGDVVAEGAHRRQTQSDHGAAVSPLAGRLAGLGLEPDGGAGF
jgi:hypothetical protein